MGGAYTFDNLMGVLKSIVDPSYLRPFLEQGYGSGLEALESLLAVYQRVDEAINRATQALYILPYSGQTAEPSSGQAYAIIDLELERTAAHSLPLVVAAGAILFEELETDSSDQGPIKVRTGRQFTLVRDVVFLPSDGEPRLAAAIATRNSFGYGNLSVGTVTGIVQLGAGLHNDRASVEQFPSYARLIAQPNPDVFLPEHVGQYVELMAGANAGAVRRIAGYEPSDAAAPHGGVAVLATTFVGRSVAIAPVGSFAEGENVEQRHPITNVLLAMGTVRAVSGGTPWYIVVEISEGVFDASGPAIGSIVGVQSGASFHVEDVTDSGRLVPEVGTAAWRIKPWWELGLEVRNVGVTSHGTIGTLDALGAERKIHRSSGESDESYRKRVVEIADVISPNAIRRIANRIWAYYGAEAILREVGSGLLPGAYYEGDPEGTTPLSGYSFDMDGLVIFGLQSGQFFGGERVFQEVAGVLTTARVTTTLAGYPPGSPVPLPSSKGLEVANVRGPGFVPGAVVIGEVSGASVAVTSIGGGLRQDDRFKLDLDYTEFRAFFLLGVPKSTLGEFGVPYDVEHPCNAYDASPWLAFHDGFPLTAAVLYRATWQAIYRARAGGVGFDLFLE